MKFGTAEGNHVIQSEPFCEERLFSDERQRVAWAHNSGKPGATPVIRDSSIAGLLARQTGEVLLATVPCGLSPAGPRRFSFSGELVTSGEQSWSEAMPDIVTAKRLREQLREPAARIRQMADMVNAENRDFTPEEREEWDRVNAEYDAIERRLQHTERAERVTAAQQEPAGDPRVGRTPWRMPRGGDGSAITEQHRSLAFQAWMAYQSGLDVSDEQQEAADLCGVRLRNTFFDFTRPTGQRPAGLQFWAAKGMPDFRAALASGTPTSGGYTVPEGFINALEINMLAFGGIRQVADVMTTTSGEPMPWPTADDTGNSGRLVGENGTISTTATHPTFGAVIFNAYKYTSDFILIPYELLTDSAFNLPDVVGRMLGERLGRITATHFTTGDGAAKPNGIVTAATLGVTAASATAIAADELYDLVHSIDPAYRVEGCGWGFHDSILKALRKLKDGNGRYLWQEGLSGGMSNMLIDYPYTILQDMASSIATTNKTMIFGQLSKYKIRDVSQVRLRRLDERYADNDQVAFVALSRHDGNLLDAGTAPVKYLQQA